MSCTLFQVQQNLKVRLQNKSARVCDLPSSKLNIQSVNDDADTLHWRADECFFFAGEERNREKRPSPVRETETHGKAGARECAGP